MDGSNLAKRYRALRANLGDPIVGSPLLMEAIMAEKLTLASLEARIEALEAYIESLPDEMEKAVGLESARYEARIAALEQAPKPAARQTAAGRPYPRGGKWYIKVQTGYNTYVHKECTQDGVLVKHDTPAKTEEAPPPVDAPPMDDFADVQIA